ncbi:hypothetical protein BKA62DRAFT_720120 [Auriculariales sp. MPI-PUGE-AT-0066]|nr:hypothetical protein BKA62DRAFT_720120 [Auriculariales sp. MPI-PUGE-AT-0066]
MASTSRACDLNPVHIRNDHLQPSWEDQLLRVQSALRSFVWVDVQPENAKLRDLQRQLCEACPDLHDINIVGPIGMAPGAIATMTRPEAEATEEQPPGSLTSGRLQDLPAWFVVDLMHASPNFESLAFGTMPYFAGDSGSTVEAVRVAKLKHLKIWDNGAYDHPLFAHILEANISALRMLEMSLGHVQLANRLTTLRLQSRATVERIDAEFAAGDWRAMNLPCWCFVPTNQAIYTNAADRTVALLACCPKLRNLHDHIGFFRGVCAQLRVCRRRAAAGCITALWGAGTSECQDYRAGG